MKKVTLFIAMSLDGFIANSNGQVDWLQGQEPGADDMVSYERFIKDIDTVIMGWTTYEQITTELSPKNWLYEDMSSYVLTHRHMSSSPNIKFVSRDVCALVRELKAAEGKGIWICGGASIIQPLIREGLIDRFHISIIPMLLGKGIRLFDSPDTQVALKLICTQSYNGITDVVYEQR